MFVVFLAIPDPPGEASRRDQEGSVSESIRWVSGKGFEEVREGPVWRSREIPKPGLFGDQVANDGVSWGNQLKKMCSRSSLTLGQLGHVSELDLARVL